MKKTMVAVLIMLSTVTVGFSHPVLADSPTICSKGSGSPPCPSGTMATGKWNASPDTWTLCDTLTDGRSVYIHAGWTMADAQSGVFRFENFNGGCISPFISVGAHTTIFWRVCGNIPADPDQCSSIRSDTV